MKKKVLIALSGGVDSAAAAALLRQQGYDCAGATLRLCQGEAAIADARRAAEALGLPFYEVDGRELFEQEVMARFTAEYCAGHTPNPCIDCNRELKFGFLMDWALSRGYDYLATGHYARVEQGPEGFRLLRGRSRRKDQSYMLYQLTQRQLSHLLLPLGELEKEDARVAARAAALPNAEKADSQDICFVPDGDYVGFLQSRGVVLQPGDFIDGAGRVLGRHRGLPCYTTGQGKGLGISLGRHVYVVAKNAADNTVQLGEDAELYSDELTAGRFCWISGRAPVGPLPCSAKTRYSQREAEAETAVLPDGRVRVTFREAQRAITAGQAVVLYGGDTVLGGGTIE